MTEDHAIRREFHVSPPGEDRNGKSFPAIEFSHAVVRGDGSLVFRAESERQAEQLASGLNDRARLAAALDVAA